MHQPARHLIECDTGGPPRAAASAVDMARRVAAGDFDADVLAWMRDCFNRIVDGGEQPDVALRLDRASRTRERNDALRRAAALLTIGNERAWPVSKRLELAVARQERLRGEPATLIEVALAQAFSCGVGVPSGQRQLYEIIR